ncbi:MAG: Rieske 2Fe-2S domain-containing protein [Desulfomonile sp.]|nr:Rieske 2Fe-2S domain-containing protein [Desulfomonile sp.]
MSAIVDFFKSIAGICRTKPLSPDCRQLDGNKATIRIGDAAELQAPGGAVYLAGKGLKTPVPVVRDDSGNYLSFSNRCTHMGRKLDPVPGKQVLRCCSVSHSTFDYNGGKLTGPAKKSVEVYPTELKDATW